MPVILPDLFGQFRKFNKVKISYLDLEKQYQSIKTEIGEAINEVLDQRSFIRGPHVERFEKEFARLHNVDYALGVGNGTDALYIALKVLEIGEGDEVITVANSFIATSEAITLTGARVVFADCEVDTYCISPSDIEAKITGKTKAIVPVHLYGHPAKMDAIMAIAKQHNLKVVEDSAQAVLAEYKGQKIGSFGDFATVSFYPGKNLGAYGDAGAILTNDKGLYTKAKMFANHGRVSKYDHEFEGINSRMDGLQGAILNVKLKYLSSWTEQRRQVAQWYHQGLKDISQVTIPVELPNVKHVYHIYPIRVDASVRDIFMDFLNDAGISVGIHYPIALPELKAYTYLNHRPEDFPNSTSFSKQLVSLPIYPELTLDQVKYVVSTIKSFFV